MDEPRRDDVFDRELRRALAAEGGATAGPHVDAELAAAWMDRQLDPVAARAVEAHLAGCQECQLVMATLARTAPDGPVAAGGIEWWRRLRAGWLIPVTVAAAAALVIWVAVPQQLVPPPRSVDSLTTAPAAPESSFDTSRLADAPEPDAAPSATPGSATPGSITALQSADASAPKAETESDRRLAGAAPEPQRKAANLAQPPPPAASPGAPPPPAAPSAPSALERRERSAQVGALNESVTVTAEQRVVDAQRADKATVAGESPAVAQERQPQQQRPQQQQQQGGSAGGLLRDVAGFAAAARLPNALAITAPGSGARWRRTGATFEFAPRADAAFSAATLPIPIDQVTAGAAPAGTVCWLVGRGGLVLVSTDGLRFARVSAPAAIDLTAVAPADALTATVTASDGRRFRTTDGGATWAAVP